MYGEIREFLKRTFYELASQKNCEIVSGTLVFDHVHMLIRIPPKYAISEIVGYLKGKSAIAVARRFSKRKRNFNGESFWARRYSVSSVGYDQESIRAYIEKQEQYDKESSSEEGWF
jgi:putative transposase